MDLLLESGPGFGLLLESGDALLIETLDEAVTLGAAAALQGQAGRRVAAFAGLVASAALAADLPAVAIPPLSMTMRVIAPTVGVGAVATPVPATLTMQVIAPTVQAGPTTATPAPLRLTMRVIAVTATVGAVPELRVHRIVSRYAVRILEVADAGERA